jgi:hypothetical protein
MHAAPLASLERSIQASVAYSPHPFFSDENDEDGPCENWLASERGFESALQGVPLTPHGVFFSVGSSGWDVENILGLVGDSFSISILVNVNPLAIQLLRLRRALAGMPECRSIESFLNLLFGYRQHSDWNTFKQACQAHRVFWRIPARIWRRPELTLQFHKRELQELRCLLHERPLPSGFCDATERGVFASEAAFRQARNALRRSILIRGDLFDPRTVGAIFSFLQNTKTPLSLVYFTDFFYLPVPFHITELYQEQLFQLYSNSAIRPLFPDELPVLVSPKHRVCTLTFRRLLLEISHDPRNEHHIVQQAIHNAAWADLARFIQRYLTSIGKWHPHGYARCNVLREALKKELSRIPGEILQRPQRFWIHIGGHGSARHYIEFDNLSEFVWRPLPQ